MKVGDEVIYKTIICPPKNIKYQAIHIKIDKPAAGVQHERWDAPFQHSPPINW